MPRMTHLYSGLRRLVVPISRAAISAEPAREVALLALVQTILFEELSEKHFLD